jgi:YfiH family protein
VLERVTFSNGVVAYVSPLLRGAGVPHAFSTRIGGVSDGPFASLNLGNPSGCPQQDESDNIAENYRRLHAAIGCGGRRRVFVHQVHGACVVDPAIASATDTIHGGQEIGRADAIVSDDASLILSVRTADCVPVLLASDNGCCVAAVHAGWRGVVANVVPAAVARFEDPRRVLATIGPSIGFDAFEVGAEVLAAFDGFPGHQAFVRRRDDGKGNVDLRRAIERQLQDVGVIRIDSTDRCTVTHSDEFFSHRREAGVTGRMAALIGAVA